MILLIDADNSPGRNIQGINKLEPEDTVHIYYASSNKYFTNRDRQAEITKIANCSVDFTKIAAADNAVDFAIAMDLRVLLENSHTEVIVLVSEDGHFRTILERAKEVTHCSNLFLAASIEEANNRYKLLESESLQDIHKYLAKSFGQEKGSELYRKLNVLFEQKYLLKESAGVPDGVENTTIKTQLINMLKAAVRTYRN